MEEREYTCKYCCKKFIPTRRRVQKFCNASCKSTYHRLKKELPKQVEDKAKVPDIPKMKIDQISMAGILNAAAGNLSSDFLQEIFTKAENKPATKRDLQLLYEKLQRYHQVKNLPRREDGAIPYFDLETKEVVYRKNFF
ncbi:hypothetical protein [Urechidicola croceus]|uniref:Uncharacterized protein n=1 Tax=Urechidicola croceus TaxID=1850246 RepID=A0A1D8P863_9FLAO|nr:hypothetical protein [Urechidicola croceus]AOW20759.1 hypothetical protein LPB138_08755 [Urechidicola croceus]